MSKYRSPSGVKADPQQTWSNKLYLMSARRESQAPFRPDARSEVFANHEKLALEYEIRQTMGPNPNTRLINFDWNEPMKSLRVEVDHDRVRQLGVSSKSLAEALYSVTTGMVVTQVRDSIYLTDLVARSPDEQRTSLQTLRNLKSPWTAGRRSC